MAGLTNVDPRNRLAVDTPPPPILKDIQGSDSSVPLSPQWLQPKLGDNKHGSATGEPHPHAGKHTVPSKILGNFDGLTVAEKRKDVYKPSFNDTEKGRRDRWGDEERETTHSAIRRDLRREGEELGDSRRLERWSNTAPRYSGEARRPSSEKWTDSGSRESAYELRRESKWNTRWGPDDKEAENRREKWSGKDGESSRDKVVHRAPAHAKDMNSQGKDTDKEGEQYSRLWRSSPVANRGKGEASSYLPSNTNKPPPMFGHGRGKGDTGVSAFSVERGRAGSSGANAIGGPTIRHFPVGFIPDRSNCSHKDSPILQYTRTKLIDIYRTTDLKGYRLSFEGFQEFPSLTQADPLMPLALAAPTAEELVIMEAIDKGDISSSGVPLASKDGCGGKNSMDSDSKVLSGDSLHQYQEIVTEEDNFKSPLNKAYDSIKGEASKKETVIPWRSQSDRVESFRPLNDRDLTEDKSGPSDKGWFNAQKEVVIEPYIRHGEGDPHWQDTNLQSGSRPESRIRSQPSEKIEIDGDGLTPVPDPFIIRDKLTDRKLSPYPSPEHLSLLYKDPQGQIQGPFSGANLIEWFDAGYFGIDLLVRPASAPPDAPFSLLGDVLPQLRTRVRPPPGFGSARQNDTADASNRRIFSSPGSIPSGVPDFEPTKNGQAPRNETKVEAENRFLESLMSGRIGGSLSGGYSFPEGMQGYNGLMGSRPSLGMENSIDTKYFTQKMPLDPQNPALSPYRVSREATPILSSADTIQEFLNSSKFTPQIGEIPLHISQPPQHIDLLSILRQNSQTGFGSLPTRIQPQFQPLLSNQTPFGNLSEFNQDGQMLDLLRQQYMLSQQLHSQVHLPGHVNQIELLLLMQRQKLEQQQQQQYLLSQALSGHHSHKPHDELSSILLNAEALNENATSKSSIPSMHEFGQNNRQMFDHNSSNNHSLDIANLSRYGAMEAGIASDIEFSNLPNQSMNISAYSNAMDGLILPDVRFIDDSNVDRMALLPDIVSAGKTSAESTSIDLGAFDVSKELPRTNELIPNSSDFVGDLSLYEKGEGVINSEPLVPEMIDHVKYTSDAISEQVCGDASELKGAKDAEQCEAKKASEKRSRKHKNSQLRALKSASDQKSKSNPNVVGAEKGETAAEPLHRAFEAGGAACAPPLMESFDSQGTLDKKTKVDDIDTKVKEGEFVPSSSNKPPWKPASGRRTKPLLEIQVEELQRAGEPPASDTIPKIIGTSLSSATPSVSSSINSDQKYAAGSIQCDGIAQSSISDFRSNPNNSGNVSRSPEVLSKVSGTKDDIIKEKSASSHILAHFGAEIEMSADDVDFIEAKDTRKSRKKAAKNKGVVAKSSLPSNPAVLPVSEGTAEPAKAARQTQQDKDLLPCPPAAPSLGDFVFWKGDQTNTVPPPAWSTDSVKLQKPSFLRDIFEEQDSKPKSIQPQTPLPTPTKVQPSKVSRESSSSALVLSSCPSKASLPANSKSASSTQASSFSLGQHKAELEDDLFWGPIVQGNEGSRPDFPSLASPSNQKVKKNPVKSGYGEESSKRASNSKPADHSFSKGKKDAESKYSEAIDFRNWCEAEWLRLTGTNDTSFLEFCLKQPTTEATALLQENLASLDHNHEFVDQFINYKNFLSPETIEIAFQPRKSSKAGGDEQQFQASRGTKIPTNVDAEADGGADGGSKGKKRGKKGKKLSPALLGFNVVSNRIMMGEIQSIED